MRRVGGKDEAPDAQFLRTPLVDFIWADVGDLVCIWLWMSREHFLELHGLALEVFLSREPGNFAVRYSPHPISADP